MPNLPLRLGHVQLLTVQDQQWFIDLETLDHFLEGGKWFFLDIIEDISVVI